MTVEYRGEPAMVAEVGQVTGVTGVTEVDELDARRTLRAQIDRLERILAQRWPTDDRAPTPAARTVAGPRILDLGELERVRDDLAAHVEALRRHHVETERRVQARRDLLAAMFDDPGAHRGVRLTAADLGEPGCTRWTVTPVLGVVGRLAGWWRVRVSSGCP